MTTGDFNYYCMACQKTYYNASICPIHGAQFPAEIFTCPQSKEEPMRKSRNWIEEIYEELLATRAHYPDRLIKIHVSQLMLDYIELKAQPRITRKDGAVDIHTDIPDPDMLFGVPLIVSSFTPTYNVVSYPRMNND